ncbi:MAG: MCE family protein [Candidatus Omnitrophica bacterium]|nr:MCE family protein [Candidatus Omnitrophota bacterium]MBD3269038.1 MCE family protein [Candidatus Omnitrophota bacterium]
MKKYSNEFKVGLFVIICVFGLFYLSYSTGKINLGEGGYRIYAVFEDISGLGEKSPVMVNGLEAGKVDNIDVVYGEGRTRMVLELWIKEGVKIRENPKISIKTLGMMGEKYIQISSRQGEGFIEPGERLEGEPFIDMDELMSNINSLTDEVKKLSQNLNYTVEDNQDEISRLIKNLEATSKNLEEFSADVKRHPWKLLFKTK